MQSPDVICISDSENEEERYLKIYYEISSKFIEIPLAGDGTLLLADIKAIEPNIAALNLTKGDEYMQLYKSKNGCFKEPPEKWNSFKIFAVLSDSITTFVKEMPTVKMDVDELCLPTVSNGEPKAAGIKQETLSGPELGDESLPSTSMRSTDTAENMIESVPSSSNVVDEMQLRYFPRKARPIQIEKERSVENGGNSNGVFINVFTDEKKIKKFNKLKRNLIHRITVAQLKLPFVDPLLISRLLFLNSNKKYHPNLKDIFPARSVCQTCNKNLGSSETFLSHIFSTKHLRSALTQDELNQLIQAVFVIDYSADNGLFYTIMKEKRKRNHQKIFNTKAATKRQRKDF